MILRAGCCQSCLRIRSSIPNTMPTICIYSFTHIFIGPESDHWECLSVTHSLTSLTDCRLVNLIDVTLACEDGNSKLVEVVTVVEVDDEKRVDNSLVADLEG